MKCSQPLAEANAQSSAIINFVVLSISRYSLLTMSKRILLFCIDPIEKALARLVVKATAATCHYNVVYYTSAIFGSRKNDTAATAKNQNTAFLT